MYDELIALATKQLDHGGAFLMTGKEERNPMTIGWCQFGRVWNKPVLTVFVRHSRHSHELLERDRIFTVSFPIDGEMKKEIGFCGTKSGRDMDKRAELGLTTSAARAGGIEGLGGCRLHFECKVLFQLEMEGHMDALCGEAKKSFYDPAGQAGENGDPHAIYYAQILDAYLI